MNVDLQKVFFIGLLILHISSYSSISTDAKSGSLDYFGNVALIINNIEVENKILTKAPSTIIANDGTQEIGKVEVGYIPDINARLIPRTEKLRKKVYELKSNSLIPDELCDYQGLLDNASSQQECQELLTLYTKLLGVAKDLGAYRKMYLETENLIDVFPTVYYHMTVIELNKIRKGEITYAADKMKQMLYFYDAYHYNRSQKEKREEHWRRHFEQVANAGNYDLCQSFRKVMTSAIRAHVRFDLARAIRHAYDFSGSTSSISVLRSEFEATNSIFALAQTKALKDISKATFCGHLGGFNFKIFGGITIDEIKSWRMEAFDNALLKRGTLPGYNGNLIDQPSYYPHQVYYNVGNLACKQDSLSCNPNKEVSSTLFLFDLSGSMSGNGGGTIPKIEQAKNAGRQTLASMRTSGQGIRNEVAIYGFEGGCRNDPTTEFFPFDSDLTAAEASIVNMYPGGGTPLGTAIRAAECKLAAHLTTIGQQQGKLILLSDGQGTCGEIRPSGVYHNAPLQTKGYTIPADQCGAATGQPVAVKYYTVGFDIPPGSPAERDLQYLSQLSGGKYLNVQNQTQLIRAFRKFNRVYQPKENPALKGLPTASVADFRSGVSEIKMEDFKKALSVNEAFVKSHANDCHGTYNLALAQEANDYYKEAIDNYRLYLKLCPNPIDQAFVEKQITFLEEEFKDFILFQKKVVKSDLDFLKLHFERIQNGQSVTLAMEFRGFLQEKGSYYEELPRLIADNNRFLINITEDIVEALERCADLIRRKPETWDRDAVPVISMTYLNLKDLLEEM